MRPLSALATVLSLAVLAGCASKSAQNSPPPAPDPVPIKRDEATPTQRAAIRTELATGYYERGQFDIALEELGEAQRLDPNYARTYNIYGLVFTMLQDTQKAEESFRRGLALAPSDPDMHANYGAFLCTTGRAREAMPEFDIAIRDPLYKTPEVPLINAGKCSIVLGDLRAADDFLRRAMAVSPGNPIAAYNLALLAYRDKRLEEARYWIRPVVQTGTARPEALLLGLCIERKLGDGDAAASYLAQIRNRYPEAVETRSAIAGNCE